MTPEKAAEAMKEAAARAICQNCYDMHPVEKFRNSDKPGDTFYAHLTTSGKGEPCVANAIRALNVEGVLRD